MGAKSDDDTKVILKKLGICLVLWYSASYVFSGILVGGFQIPYDGRIPFDHSNFNPAAGGKNLACWLNLILTYVVGVFLLFFVVRSTRKTLDYACSMSFIHVVLSCIVMASEGPPSNWIWWVTLLVCTFLLSTLGELSCYYLRDLREIKIDRT
eukprot:tig00000852_g5048.t1